MEKYLQLLLKEVNTVIIPGLGTLTMTNQSTGETMFMSYLKYDDGKLSTYISQKEGCTDEEAKNMISETVQSILNTVEANKVFPIGSLGSFSKDKNGELQFVDGEVVDSSPIENEVEQPKEAIVENKSEVIDISVPETPVPVEEIPVTPLPKKKGFFGILGKKDKVATETSMEDTMPQSFDTETIVDQSAAEQVSDVNEKEDLQVEPSKIETSLVDEQVADEALNDVEEEISSEDEAPEIVEVIVTEEISVEISSDEQTGLVTEDIHIHEEIKVLSDEAPLVESAPSHVSVTEEPMIEKNNDASESDVNIELEEPAIVFEKTKKKRGVVFWILMSLIVIIIAGGTFIGLNFDKYKQYIPFIAENTKTLKSDEAAAIKEFESNNTKPTTEEPVSSAKDMIETTEETAPIENTMPVEESVPVEPKKKTVRSSVSHSSEASSSAPASSGGEYYIVLATFSEKTNADSYVVKLVSGGNSSATLIERDGKFSVCYGSYSSKGDATSNLSKAREVSSNAWLLHKAQ